MGELPAEGGSRCGNRRLEESEIPEASGTSVACELLSVEIQNILDDEEVRITRHFANFRNVAS